LFFGGSSHAVHQLGIELLGIVTVMATVFCLSFATVAILARLFGGILNQSVELAEPDAEVIA
jgi:ammonia channel protein AmtB